MSKTVEIKALEKTKGGYQLISDASSFWIDGLLLHKYRLKAGMSMEQQTFLSLKKEAELVYYDQLAIKKMKKLLTTHELSQYLQDKGCPASICRELLTKYIRLNYIDDLHYAKHYVMRKKHKEGPRLIKEKLRDKGITEQTLKYAFERYDEHQLAQDIIEKSIKSNTKKSLRHIKNTVYSAMIAKGFSSDVIQDILTSVDDLHTVDELELVKKQASIAYTKYLKTADSKEALRKTVMKLRQKGFQSEDIHQAIESLAVKA